ncbi:MAG TPA: hypothetical protein VHO70_05265 [Chitinispirillaceae bacterium]|nr:hypothetical protein [Chitinispirillaceae bacterium]
MTAKGTDTDALLFADNFSKRKEGYPGVVFYGNPILKTLQTNVRTSVTFAPDYHQVANQCSFFSKPESEIQSGEYTGKQLQFLSCLRIVM